jgi:hypothetical protein
MPSSCGLLLDFGRPERLGAGADGLVEFVDALAERAKRGARAAGRSNARAA